MLVSFEIFYPRNQESNSGSKLMQFFKNGLQEDVKKEKKLENEQLEVNGLEKCDKELPKAEIMQEPMEKTSC